MKDPDIYPNEIMGAIMDFSDRELIIEHLQKYQKSNGDWDLYRKKMPEVLLKKWLSVLNSCRENGFISPKIWNDKIQWKQIMGFKRNYDNADQCTLCPKTQRSGSCMGKMINKNNQKMFNPCWGKNV